MPVSLGRSSGTESPRIHRLQVPHTQVVLTELAAENHWLFVARSNRLSCRRRAAHSEFLAIRFLTRSKSLLGLVGLVGRYKHDLRSS